MCGTTLTFGTDASAADTTAPTASGASPDQLQEIVVTANRLGEQDLQAVPTAISSLDTESLDREGLQSLTDIARSTPGISVSEQGGGKNTVVIRGIVTVGSPDPTNVEDQPAVSVYLDDTPISLAGATPDLRVFDLERVEIVRGPQGTLYGAGAMAGNIRYITRKPDSTGYAATLEASGVDTRYGGDGYSFRGMINAPLIKDALALRVSAYQGEDPGYIDNVGRAVKDSNRQDNTQVRAALRLDDHGPLVVDGSFLYGRVHRSAPNATYVNFAPYEYSATGPEFYRDRFGIANLTISYHADLFDLISSSSYVDRSTESATSSEVIAAYFLGLNTLSVDYLNNDIHDFTQEIRLAATHWSHLKGQIGVFYENQHRRYTQDFPTAGADAVIGASSLVFDAFQSNDIFSAHQNPDTRQIAEFGDITYSPVDQLDLTAGLRHFDWRQSFYLFSGGAFGALGPGQPLTTSQSSTESGVNPRFNVTYHVHDSIVFAEAAKGFRYGGINQPVPQSLCAAALAAIGLTSAPLTYGPDYLWTYSLGEKATAFDRRFTINTTAFYTNWSDVQTKKLLTTCGYYYERNKGDVRSTGVELETHWLATTGLTLGLSASYTHAAANGPIEDLNAASGARVPYFPRVIASLQGDYRRTIPWGGLQLQADYTYRGNMVTDFDPTNALLYREIPAIRVLNAALTIAHGPTEWTLYGRNLTNERVTSIVAPNLYGAAQPGGDVYYLGLPLTLGIRAAVRF